VGSPRRSFAARTKRRPDDVIVLDLAHRIFLFESARMIGGKGRLSGILVALATTTLACGRTTVQDYCPTVEPSGGDVVGSWATNSQCTAPYDRLASTDWCSQLVFDDTGIRVLMLGHPQMIFKTGTVSFTDPSGGMTAGASQGIFTSMLHFESVPDPDAVPGQGNNRIFFPRSCLTAGGRTQGTSCDDLTAALGGFLADPSQANQSFRILPLSQFPNYPPGTAPQANYTTYDCVSDVARNGCSCGYTVTLDVPDTGGWGIDGGVLSLYSASSAPAYVNDYAASASVLAMSGHGGIDIFGQQGLRLLTFSRK
jgi:hypothetical protein